MSAPTVPISDASRRLLKELASKTGQSEVEEYPGPRSRRPARGRVEGSHFDPVRPVENGEQRPPEQGTMGPADSRDPCARGHCPARSLGAVMGWRYYRKGGATVERVGQRSMNRLSFRFLLG